jgi:hypothetical protein
MQPNKKQKFKMDYSINQAAEDTDQDETEELDFSEEYGSNEPYYGSDYDDEDDRYYNQNDDDDGDPFLVWSYDDINI